MEVRDKAIDAVELHARVQKNGGVAAAGADLAVLCGNGFQCTAAGGTHGDHTMPCGFGVADHLSGLFIDAVPFAVHFVIRDLILLHRAEGAQTHMQGHFSNVHALGTDGIHQLRREMQAGRRGCSTAKLLCVDSLILALILQLLCDVGRQRHFAKFVQLFIKCLSVIIKCNVLVAIFHGLIHHSSQGAIAKAHFGAGLHPLAGLCQTFPLVTFDLTQQKQLTHSTGGLLDAHDAGRQDLGIVYHQQVARL